MVFAKSSRLLLLGSCSLLFVGCLTSKREEELRNSIHLLETRVAELQKQLEVKDKSISTVKTEAETTHRNVQATKTDLDEMRRELSLTQGAIDELRLKMTRLQEASANSGAPTGSGNVNDEHALTLHRKIALADIQLRALRDELHSGSKKGKTQKYKSAAELTKTLVGPFVKKEYKKVIQLASSVIDGGAPADQVETALSFRGESYFATQNYDHAAQDFSEILIRFPKSEKRARALLMSGDSFVYLKQPYAAKSFYAECVQSLPEREECKASKERLDRLGV